MSKLESLDMRESIITVLPQKAFKDCYNLKWIYLPSCLTKIEENAFQDCTSLTGIYFEKGSELNSIGYGYSESGSYPYPTTYTYSGAFIGCTSLKSITIPAKVRYIGSAMFQNCSSLEKVDFEQGSLLTEISGTWNRASAKPFYGCKSLRCLDFSNCKQLASLRNDSPLPGVKEVWFGTAEPPKCPYTASNVSGEFSYPSAFSTSEVIYVPKEALERYKTQWPQLSNKIIGY